MLRGQCGVFLGDDAVYFISKISTRQTHINKKRGGSSTLNRTSVHVLLLLLSPPLLGKLGLECMKDGGPAFLCRALF